MSIGPFRRGIAALALVAISCALPAFAQDDDDSQDPPDRVARLSYLQGDVSLQPAGSEDWTQAAKNRPLTIGDKLWVDKESRVELEVGGETIHVDEGTGLSFLDLSDDAIQMQLTDGAVHVRIDRLRDGEVVEVDTPNAAVTLTRPGDYHVETKHEGDGTFVKVYRGEAEVRGNDDTTRLNGGEQAEFSGTDRLAVNQGRADERSDFDAWANSRNNRYAQSASAQYVDPEVIGHEDLDDNGEWQSSDDYGPVWIPTHVAAEWAPYRYGHWIWVAPWGWTWVDDAPWGFAPFHYGRWAYWRSRWVWVPGPRHVRPIYAPALVAWVGGPNVSVSVSVGGGVGWFPLAPREVFVPAYRCGPRHLQQVNISNTVIVNRTYITNVYQNRVTNIRYANRGVGNAVTVVQRDTFVSARPVAGHLVQVHDVTALRTETRGPAIAPERASTLGPRWNPDRNRAPAAFRDRTVVVNRAPPPARASFAVERQAIVANGGHPVARQTLVVNRSEPRPDVRRVDTGPGPGSGPRLEDAKRDMRGNDVRNGNGGSSTKNEIRERTQERPQERPADRPSDRPPNARIQPRRENAPQQDEQRQNERRDNDHMQRDRDERIQSMHTQPDRQDRPNNSSGSNQPDRPPAASPPKRVFQDRGNERQPQVERQPERQQPIERPAPRFEQPRSEPRSEPSRPEPRAEQPRPQPHVETPKSQPRQQSTPKQEPNRERSHPNNDNDKRDNGKRDRR